MIGDQVRRQRQRVVPACGAALAKAALAKIWFQSCYRNYFSTTSLFRITGSAPRRRFGNRPLRISNCSNGLTRPQCFAQRCKAGASTESIYSTYYSTYEIFYHFNHQLIDLSVLADRHCYRFRLR